MIAIIHGEDLVSSRNYYIHLRSQAPNPVILDGSTAKLEEISQSLGSDGLFTEEKNIFIEDFFSKRKIGKEAEMITAYINNNHSGKYVTFWESKELSAKQLHTFGTVTTKVFKVNKTIFQFLDAIKPQNTKQMLSLFHKTLETDEEQVIFFMLIAHLRLLLSFCEDDTTQTIDEIKRMKEWRKEKLKKQTRYFTRDRLQYLYHQLFLLDHAQKTGGLVCSLGLNIDFWLLEI